MNGGPSSDGKSQFRPLMKHGRAYRLKLRIATHEGTVSASKYASAKGCIQRLSRPQNEAKIINGFKGAGASVNLAYYANVPA